MSTYIPESEVTPRSPLWWLHVLETRLLQRQGHMILMDRYYRGDHPLPFLTKAHNMKMRDEFKTLIQDSRSNFMRLVVDATEERLSVDGYRLSANSDAVTDAGSWDLWQANDMDAQSQIAFVESLVKGVSYLSVWDDDDGDGYADIAVEDPLQTIVAYEPGSNHRRRAAALKVWLDDISGLRRANVYLPDGIYKFSCESGMPSTLPENIADQIQPVWAEIEDGFVPNPLGVVPIIPLRNRARLLIEGESELEDVYRVQNQINGFLFLLALAGYFGAHKQRWATGVSMMVDNQGKPKEPWDVAIDRILASEDPAVKFGEFSQTDLNGYIKAIEQKIMHIAVTTRTPRHYLIEQGQSPSGDAIRSAESGLVKKVLRKQRTFGEGLEEALNLARQFQGEKDVPVDSEVVWLDPQTHTEGVITDAVVKQYEARLIPHSIALERLGYTQTEIRQILAANDSEFAPMPAPGNIQARAQVKDVLTNTPSGA